jgi:PAS domain S-box-containing protein
MASMPSDAITVLLVSEQAEEVKLITQCLRSFYLGCRVEVVYSPGEALEWASKQNWHIILLDESLLDPRAMDTLQEVRRRAPRSAVVVAAVRQDTGVALDLMRQGADYALFKNTPAFLTELPIVTRQVLEKRELRAHLDLAHDRYLRLIDNLTDVAYELDAEGRFLYISPAVQPLLHYDPQALIGLHYSTLIPPEDLESADRRFNERRSESRATRRFKLRLLDKDRRLPPLVAEINATALYDRHRQFVGTVGLVRSTAGIQQLQALQRLTDLPPSLTRILTNTEQLLQTVHDLCEQAGLSPAEKTIPSPSRPKADQVVAASRSEQVGQDVRKSAPSFEERRHSPRNKIHMDARASSNGMSWEGTALNISLGGIYILFKGQVLAREHQLTRLGFGSDVGVLEIPGTIRHIHTTERESSPAKESFTGLAIQFSPLKEVEGKILQSLMEGLRTRSISMTCTALLIRQPLDPPHHENSRAERLERVGPTGIDAGPIPDRRQAARVNLAIPVQVELSSPTASLPEDSAITNVSAGGACLRLRSSLDLRGQRIILRFSSPDLALPQIALPRDQPEYRLMGDVMWVASDSGDTRLDASDAILLRLGLRFVYDPSIQGDVTALLRRYLTVDRIQRSDEDPSILTEFLQCTNERGQLIALGHDHPSQDLPPTAPIVIVAPGYGRTKREYIELAYYFASNGCRVLRYDHSHHVGESDGGMVLTTLTRMQEDLNAVIEYAARLWPASPLAIAASDVSARVALKIAGRHPFVKLLILLAPVLDLQYTLMAAHQEDLIAASVQGMTRGISNVLGFNIDADAWLADAIHGSYADFQTTCQDLAHMHIPLLVFSSEQDLWIRPNAFAPVKLSLGETFLSWHAMPEARHGIVDHPDQARVLFRQIMAHCRNQLYPLSNDKIREPVEAAFAQQAQLELERARLHHQTGQAATVEFWRDYLDRSHSLVNFSEYWHMLDHVHRLLGPLDNNARVLDAGCGNGNFGMFLLIAASFRPPQLFGPENRLHYIGVDLVASGLEHAKTNLIRVAAELRGKFAATAPLRSVMKAGLACIDLNAPLPFQDGQFDRVICNLVLGYLRDPLFTLRELIRVLAPGGKLVLTHFKPQANLAQIYRQFVSLAKSDLDRQQAKETVEASGRITQPSHRGTFRFFDRQELAMLLMSSGASQPRIYSTFANQAYIAVAEKPSFATSPH